MITTIIVGVVCFFVGGIFGVVIAALMVASSRGKERENGQQN